MILNGGISERDIFGCDSRGCRAALQLCPCSAFTPRSPAPHCCANTQSRCPKADGSHSQWRQQENEMISHLRGSIFQAIHSGLGRVMCLSIMLVPLLDSLLERSRNPLPCLPLPFLQPKVLQEASEHLEHQW